MDPEEYISDPDRLNKLLGSVGAALPDPEESIDINELRECVKGIKQWSNALPLQLCDPQQLDNINKRWALNQAMWALELEAFARLAEEGMPTAREAYGELLDRVKKLQSVAEFYASVFEVTE